MGPAAAGEATWATSGQESHPTQWPITRLPISPTVSVRGQCLGRALGPARVAPARRMLMQLLGSFAEFERAMVRECTRAGLKAAAARDRKGGRQPKLTPSRRRR